MIRISLMTCSVLGIFVVSLAGCAGVRPADLGVKDGKLAPCPRSPNCVSSQSVDKEHFAAPLTYTGSAPQALAALKNIILGMKRTNIVEEHDAYIHAEFTSALWRFVDDVEFSIDDAAKVIHLRSASRLGTSDLGVNRKRVEAIRDAWTARGK